MKWPILFWITLLFNSPALSQISDGGLPIENASLNSDRIDTRIMDDIPLADLMAEDDINDKYGNQAWRFAYPFQVSISMQNSGTWTRQANGSDVWRLKIICPYATSINFIFDEFYIPTGGKLFIYNESKTEILGAFTANNNKAHKIFATALILDDHAILQYESNPRNNENPILSIKQVSHGYRGFVAPTNARGLNDAGSCQVNINCSEGDDWQDEKRGIARILIGGTLTCSGSLVNNTNSDNMPYFLTANHCIGSLDAVNNPDPGISATYIFYFNYERPSCANSGTVPIETVNGSILIANDSPSDFALFLLDDNPADNYNVTFNGLNGSNNVGLGGVGIHHPAFDAKKIATHSMAPLNQDYPGSPDSSHWAVNWDATANGHSVTEGGSSGSPLFDANGYIIGQLHGGSSVNCNDPANDPGIYGKLSYSWNNNGATDNRRKLGPWLNPINPGKTTVEMKRSIPTVGFVKTSSTIKEANSDTDNDCLDFKLYPIEIRVSFAPSENVDLSLNISGTASYLDDYELSPSSITLDSSNLSGVFELKIYDDPYLEDDEEINMELLLDNNGGNAVLSNNKKDHLITIINDELDPTGSVPTLLTSAEFELSTDSFLVRNYGAGDPWNFGDTATASSFNWKVPDNGSSTIAFINDDACNCDMDSTFLLSHPFDLLGYTNAKLFFDSYFEGNVFSGIKEEASVWISINNDTLNPTFLMEIPAAIDVWQYGLNIDLSNYINNQDIRIHFKYTDNGGWLYGCAIDNVAIWAGQQIRVDTLISDSLITEQHLGPFATVHYFNPVTSDVVASIENYSSHDFGCTTIEIDRAGGSAPTVPFSLSNPANFLVSKSIKVIPENLNDSASFKITMYMTAEEELIYRTETGQANGMELIKVTGNSIKNVTPSNADSFNIEHAPATITNLGPTSNFQYSAIFENCFSGFGLGNLSVCEKISSSLNTGLGSLRAAIACAPSGDTIDLDAILLNDTIQLLTSKLVIDKELIIQASTSNSMYIQLTDLDTAIYIQPGAALTLRGFTFKNNNSTQNVIIHNQGELFLEDITIELPNEHEGFILNQGALEVRNTVKIVRY